PRPAPRSRPTAHPAPIATGFVLSDQGRLQPLAGLYPTVRALAAAEEVWTGGGRAVKQFVARLGVETVEVDEPKTLANVNTPAEYRAARDKTAAFTGGSSSTRSRRKPPLLAFAGHSGS